MQGTLAPSPPAQHAPHGRLMWPFVPGPVLATLLMSLQLPTHCPQVSSHAAGEETVIWRFKQRAKGHSVSKWQSSHLNTGLCVQSQDLSQHMDLVDRGAPQISPNCSIGTESEPPLSRLGVALGVGYRV